MEDNSDSGTAKSWSEQEEELEAFGLSTLATAYGVKAGALKARISSAAITAFGERFWRLKSAGGEVDLAKVAEIDLPQDAGAGAGAGAAADEESWKVKVLQVVEEAWPASGGETVRP